MADVNQDKDLERGECGPSSAARQNDAVQLGSDNSDADTMNDGANPANGGPVVPTRTEDSEARSIGGQRATLTKKQLWLAYPALCAALFVSFIDQTSVSTAIPVISGQLNTGSATSWIGASFLISSTAFQLINGRLSDLFGRKNLMIVCFALLAIGDLLCGFAKSPAEMFAFRAIAGIGGGGVNSLSMIIVSDITTLENRGQYQGIIGAVIALANGVAPFVRFTSRCLSIAGALVESTTWSWVFWIVPILAAPALVVIIVALPLKHRGGQYMEKVKSIDYGGIILSLVSVLLVLIPLSGGGVTYAWNSAEFIAMFTLGAIAWIAFVIYEWKVAPIPIMPIRLYQSIPCAFMYAQSFVMGLCFFGNFFYIPIYFQMVLGLTPLVSGACMLPLVLVTALSSIASGQYMARFHRYMPCAAAGFTIWALANGLTCMFGRGTQLSTILPILAVEGIGIGLTLQPVLVGLLANSRSEDRAVCTGLRNFLRTVGGSFGLVVSGAILSNTLSTGLSGLPFVTSDMLKTLTSSTYALDSMGLTEAQRDIILDVYMTGLRDTFIFWTACSGLGALMSFGIGNADLSSKSPKAKEEAHMHEEEEISTPEPNATDIEAGGQVTNEEGAIREKETAVKG